MFEFVGETLRRLRKERGKTLAELGAEAQVGKGQLSRIENGKQEATLETLSRLLQAHGVTRQEFFRRYDLVETEALQLRRGTGKPRSSPPAAGAAWPQGLVAALSRFESFVASMLGRSRPVAQGMIEVGDLVVVFRVVPRGATPLADEGSGSADDEG